MLRPRRLPGPLLLLLTMQLRFLPPLLVGRLFQLLRWWLERFLRWAQRPRPQSSSRCKPRPHLPHPWQWLQHLFPAQLFTFCRPLPLLALRMGRQHWFRACTGANLDPTAADALRPTPRLGRPSSIGTAGS
jgi:hypothetical protein